MLEVTLQKDNQFGHDGPQSGARGNVMEIMKDSDNDYWALVRFFEGVGIYWVPLDYVLHPQTNFTETYWSTDV